MSKTNEYDLTGEYGIGYTSQGKEFYFSLEDYDLIKNYCWRIDMEGYAHTIEDGKHIRLHKLLMPEPGKLIDHINRNRIDNRRENLRYVTYSENIKNSDRCDKAAAKRKEKGK